MHKIGIIGLGNFGINFYKASVLIKKAKLISVCDIDNNKIEMIKQEKSFNHDVVVTENIENFLNSGIDTALIATPAYDSFKISSKLLDEGINVLSAIPLTNNIKDGKELIKIEEKSKAKFMACHLLEYFSPYAQLKNILERGKIGKAYFMRTSLGGGYPASWNNWLDEDELGGGVINNLGINHFYYHISLFGKVKRVFARRAKYLSGMDKKDYSLILLRFEDGSIVHSELSWAYPDGHEYLSKLDVFGTNGQIYHDELERGPIIFLRGMHLTLVHTISCGLRDHSTSTYILSRNRWGDHCLLKQPIEKLPTETRSSSVEAKRKLIQVIIQMRRLYSSLFKVKYYAK